MGKQVQERICRLPLVDTDEPGGIVRMEIAPERVQELAQSISEIGQQQPIVVRPVGKRFEIIAGHRRFLACKLLEQLTVDAVVRKMSDREAAVARATENLQRVDLSPLEEAAAYDDLHNEHKMSFEQIAQKIGRTPGTIKRRMYLLKMHPLLQQAVHKKQISMSVAEELWPIAGEADLEYYLTFAIENGVTKDVARQWCKDWKDTQRRQQAEGSGEIMAPAVNEPRPIFISCDTCLGPVELGQDKVMRVCPTCAEAIRKACQ